MCIRDSDSVDNVSFYLKNHEIDSFNPLILRIEDVEIEKLMEISKNGWNRNWRFYKN